jgi:predicted alpha/beta-fold hydrolase
MAEDVGAAEDGQTTRLLRIPEFTRRRASVRYPSPGVVRLVSATTVDTAWVVNLSQTGVGLLLRRHLEREAPLFIQVHGLTRGVSRELFARVAHSTAQGSGEWLVGCRFAEELSSQELGTILQDIGG